MNTIHIPKVTNNIAEMPDTHVLLFGIPMNSEAIVSKMPELRLGSPKVATSQPAVPTELPRGCQVNRWITKHFFPNWDLASLLFCFLIHHYLFSRKWRNKHGNNFPKVVICLVICLKCLQSYRSLSLPENKTERGQTFGNTLILLIRLGKCEQQKWHPRNLKLHRASQGVQLIPATQCGRTRTHAQRALQSRSRLLTARGQHTVRRSFPLPLGKWRQKVG